MIFYKAELPKFLNEQNIYEDKVFEYYCMYTKNYILTDDKELELAGCFTKIENGKLKEVNILAPEILDLKSLVVNIHEYVHLRELLNYLNKRIDKIEFNDVMPFYFERLYLIQNKNIELEEHLNDLIIKQDGMQQLTDLEKAYEILNKQFLGMIRKRYNR